MVQRADAVADGGGGQRVDCDEVEEEEITDDGTHSVNQQMLEIWCIYLVCISL